MTKPLRLLAAILCLFLVACASTEDPDAIPSQADLQSQNVIASDTINSTPLPTEVVATNTPAPPTVPPTATNTSAPPTATFTPFPTPLPTWTPTATPINTPRPMPTRNASSAPLVVGMHSVIGVTPQDLLNIRNEPGLDGEIIGTIPAYGQQVELLDETRDVDGSNWARVTYYDRTGWVNTTFLARQIGTLDGPVADTALRALNALRNGDMLALAEWVHPDKGVTFAPTAFIDDDSQVFSAESIPDLWMDETSYLWGVQAGSGDPIELTFKGFYDAYLYSADFLFADAIGYDTNIIESGIIDNSRDRFPTASIVEYHFDGFDPDFSGLDYRTLRIVVEPFESTYRVVAIVNSEWSP